MLDTQKFPACRLSCEIESRKDCEAAMLILTEPLRLRHFTYPRSARQRRTLLRIHLQQRTTTYLPASPTYQPTPLNSQPQTLTDPQRSFAHKKPLHCRSSARQHRGKPHQLLSRNGRLSLPCPKQFIPCMRFGFRKTCKPLSRPSDTFPPDGQFILSLPPNIQILF